MQTFDQFWNKIWTVSASTGIMDNAFREIAERAWYAAQYEVIDALKKTSLEEVEELIDQSRNGSAKVAAL